MVMCGFGCYKLSNFRTVVFDDSKIIENKKIIMPNINLVFSDINIEQCKFKGSTIYLKCGSYLQGGDEHFRRVAESVGAEIAFVK